MCSEVSPRISFSRDLGQTDMIRMDHGESRRDTMLLNSNSDFEFNICSSYDQESSSADELFANGMLLPVQIQQKRAKRCELPALVSLPPRPSPSVAKISKKETNREIMSDLEEKPPAKSFWGFKRSSSLNCDIKKSLICSLPILSRSNSTGSVPKRPKEISKSSSQKNSFPSNPNCKYQLLQKPPLKKNHGGAYGNGVRISPVLNVPPPFISKGTANFLGLGSLLRNGSKDKKSKK